MSADANLDLVVNLVPRFAAHISRTELTYLLAEHGILNPVQCLTKLAGDRVGAIVDFYGGGEIPLDRLEAHFGVGRRTRANDDNGFPERYWVLAPTDTERVTVTATLDSDEQWVSSVQFTPWADPQA